MKQGTQITPERCAHCGVARPTMNRVYNNHVTSSHDGRDSRSWAMYACSTCGGVVLTVGATVNPGLADVHQTWPAASAISEDIPERARTYLSQALASLHAPAGAIMLAASSVDAMLKEKGFKNGTLNARIDEAANAHLITNEMAAWAHEIRLDANDQRHADEDAPLPTNAEALKTVEFAQALGQFLFELPAMVTRGRKPTATP